MHKRVFHLIHAWRNEIVAVGATLLLCAALLVISNPLLSAWQANSVQVQSAKVEDAIDEELVYLSKQREEIIASQVFQNALVENNAPRILSIAVAEAEKRNLDFVVITDKNGFVLARSHLPNQKGDNVFQTTEQGVLVADGETVTAIVRGARSPLVSMSDSLIVEDGEISGSIVVGDVFTDEYAREFQKKYLNEDTHIAFYTPRKGIVSTSFNDKETIHLLAGLFSAGSDIVVNRYPQLPQEVKIGSRYYATHNVIFPGITESSGGAVVLLPTNHLSHSIAFAVAMCFFFLFFFLLLPHFHAMRRHRHSFPIVVLITVLLFVFVFGATYQSLDRKAIEVAEVPPLIYNSTMKVEPEADLIDQSVEKTVALEVFTGGEAINVIRAVLHYDPERLKVTDILTTRSVCDPLLFLDKSIDNTIGEVRITCVTPNVNPGFYQPRGVVAELVIVPLKEGEAVLRFANGTQVLASDGFQTDVLRATVDASYEVVSSLKTRSETNHLSVFSPTHPNSTRWYQQRDIRFTWLAVGDATYYYVFDSNATTTPLRTASSTNASHTSVSATRDGTHYFHVRAQDPDGRVGPTSHFRALIDSTPPPSPVIQRSVVKTGTGQLIRLRFVGEDDMSGVQKNFYLRFNKDMWFPTAEQVYIPVVGGRGFTVSVRVFDNAGNFTDTSETIVPE